MKNKIGKPGIIFLLLVIFLICTAGGLTDGNYAVDVALSGGSGKVSAESPARLIVENGNFSAQITLSSPDYDRLVIDGETFYNQAADGGNAEFLIPIPAFDEEIPVTANLTRLGEPHEIQYTLCFYADSIGPESTLPQEGAKRVLFMAGVIIAVGGILNHFTAQKRKQDYTGRRK